MRDFYLHLRKDNFIQQTSKEKTEFKYDCKFEEETIKKAAAFPGFNEDTFPLVLIREMRDVGIFNTKLKEYIQVLKLPNSMIGQEICFLDQVKNDYAFITEHTDGSMGKYVIPEVLIKAALGI